MEDGDMVTQILLRIPVKWAAPEFRQTHEAASLIEASMIYICGWQVADWWESGCVEAPSQSLFITRPYIFKCLV